MLKNFAKGIMTGAAMAVGSEMAAATIQKAKEKYRLLRQEAERLKVRDEWKKGD